MNLRAALAEIEGITCADCGSHEPFGHYDEDTDTYTCDACWEWAQREKRKETTR